MNGIIVRAWMPWSRMDASVTETVAVPVFRAGCKVQKCSKHCKVSQKSLPCEGAVHTYSSNLRNIFSADWKACKSKIRIAVLRITVVYYFCCCFCCFCLLFFFPSSCFYYLSFCFFSFVHRAFFVSSLGKGRIWLWDQDWCF